MQFDFNWKDLGIFKSAVTPMKALGVRVNPMKFKYGNQFQYCEKISNPDIAYIFGIPDLVVREIDIFLPPTSKIPTLKIAPILAMI